MFPKLDLHISPSDLDQRAAAHPLRSWSEKGRRSLLTDFYGEDRYELVQKLAYEHLEKRGRPLGSPELDWFPAERAARSYLLASGIPLGPDQGLYR